MTKIQTKKINNLCICIHIINFDILLTYCSYSNKLDFYKKNKISNILIFESLACLFSLDLVQTIEIYDDVY